MVHVVLPGDVDDPDHPSGGNAYDRRLVHGLRALGWPVHEHPVPGAWPTPSRGELEALARMLADLPDGEVVLVDGLVAGPGAGALEGEAGRLRLVVLVHMVGLPGERAALAAAGVVVATSRWTRDRLVERHGLPPDSVRMAVPGVDPGPQAADPSVVGPHQAAGPPVGGRLLSIGAVTPTKGHDLLLEALSRVSDLDWRWTCIGPLDRDPGHVHALRARVAGLGLADRVDLTGPLPHDEVGTTLARADLLVHPSREEAYGMVVTEALARGVPVVAAEVGGVPEALGHDASGVRPGILVPADDPAALAGALRDWLERARLREQLRTAARGRRDVLPSWADTAGDVARALTVAAEVGSRART